MKILLIEDDKNLSATIAEQLQNKGYIVDCCTDGETALMYALNIDFSYDVVLLDRLLPVIDGLTILKAMREKHIQTPVIFITALSELEDRITGLDCGADDYLVKPFYVRELLARIRALTRRPPELSEDNCLSTFDLTLDINERRLTYRNVSILLTPKESELLAAFMSHPSKTFSREQLVWMVWGSSSDIESGNVDNYIYFLRKRLKSLECQATIKTVYGAGYRLEVDNA